MIDCEEIFMDQFHQLTKSYPSFGSNNMIVEKEILRNFIDYGQDTCVHHNDEERRIICLECRAVVCVRCLLEDHKSHLWSDLEEIVQRFRKFTDCDDHAISGCLRQCRDRKLKLVAEKAEFLSEVAASEKAIVKAGQDLKDLIDKHTQLLVDELSQLKMRKLGEIETEKQEVEKELKILELCYSDLEQKATDTAFCFPSNSFVSRTEEKANVLSEKEKSRHRATMVAFHEADILEQLKANGSNLIGRLQAEFDLLASSTQDSPEMTLIDFPSDTSEFRSAAQDDDCHVTVQLMTLLDTDDWSVFGVAAMRNRLYVLLSNSIVVYDTQEPFNRVDRIKAPQFLYPFDMAACPRTLCLYVTDNGHMCLWRVDSDHQVTSWLVGMADPSTVSVSAQTGLVTIIRSGLTSMLEVYDPTGELVSVFQLPDFVTEPQHAVATSSGDTVLCYRQRSSKTWGVCRLTPEGQLIVKCELKDTFHHLAATPCHLALDEFDRVFVADWQRKIDLFDPQLNWDRTLVSSRNDGIERPERICYDRHNGLLMVVHAWGKKTYVYRFIATNIPDNGRKRVNRW